MYLFIYFTMQNEIRSQEIINKIINKYILVAMVTTGFLDGTY